MSTVLILSNTSAEIPFDKNSEQYKFVESDLKVASLHISGEHSHSAHLSDVLPVLFIRDGQLNYLH
jgi:hypothetical protein